MGSDLLSVVAPDAESFVWPIERGVWQRDADDPCVRRDAIEFLDRRGGESRDLAERAAGGRLLLA